MSAIGRQIPHLQPEMYFPSGTRPDRKCFGLYLLLTQQTLRGFFDILTAASKEAAVFAASIANSVAQTTFEDKEIRLVFLSETGDTRYDEYSVLRSLEVAEEVEARKAG